MAETLVWHARGEGIRNVKVDGSKTRWAESAGVFGMKIKRTQDCLALYASCFR